MLRKVVEYGMKDNLDLDCGIGNSLFSLSLLGGFETHDSASPLTSVLVEFLRKVGIDGGDDCAQVVLVRSGDFRDGEHGGRFHVDNSAESGFALDDTVRDTHLLTQCGQVDDELDWVDIVRDDDELCFLVLNQRDDVVESEFDSLWFWRGFRCGGSVLGGLCSLCQTVLLLSSCLWAVGIQELEELRGSVLVKCVLELSERRRDLEALVEDLLLTLQLDIFRPFHESREVLLGLDVLSDSKVSCPLLDQRILWCLFRCGLRAGEGRLCSFWSLERKISLECQTDRVELWSLRNKPKNNQSIETVQSHLQTASKFQHDVSMGLWKHISREIYMAQAGILILFR